jgi:cytidylate kinase
MRYLVYGSPASGKTTLADRLAEEYGLSVLYLDDYVRELGPQSCRDTLVDIGDGVIDIACRKLLANAARSETIVVELSHHDFSVVSCLASAVWKIHSAVLLVLWAPLPILLDRNRHRRPLDQVPEVYIGRCWEDTRVLLGLVESDQNAFFARHAWIASARQFDSSHYSTDSIIASVLADATLRVQMGQ